MGENTEAPEKQKRPEKAEQPEQAEQPDQTEELEQHEHHPAKQSSGGSWGFLGLLLAIVAIVVVFLLWQRQQALQQESQTLQQGLTRLLTVVEENYDTQEQKIAGHNHPATEAQVERMALQIDEFRSLLGQEQQEWFIAEIAYLLRTASYRLSFEYDPETALAALNQARQRLISEDRDIYQTVIEQITKDIAKISDVSHPNRSRIAAEISALIAASEHWSFAVRQSDNAQQTPPAADQVEPEDQTAQTGGMQRILSRMWEDFKGLVTIRRNGEVARPLLQPQQRYFLQQNMQLKLQAARLALLAGDNDAYRDSLVEASDWLTHYFDSTSLPVSEAQATIEQLAAIELTPGLPTLSNTIALLRQAALKSRPSAETPPAATTPPPAESEQKPDQKPGQAQEHPKPDSDAPVATALPSEAVEPKSESIPPLETPMPPGDEANSAPAADPAPDLPQGNEP